MKNQNIKIIKLKIVPNTKGDILKFLQKDKMFNIKFSEIYFSEIKKGHIKGWNLHKRSFCFITVPYGRVKFKIKNKKFKTVKEIIISKKNYKCLLIPPLFWFSFQSISKLSVIVNVTNKIHSKTETLKIPIS